MICVDVFCKTDSAKCSELSYYYDNLKLHRTVEGQYLKLVIIYEGWNFNSGNYLFTTDTK